MDHSKFYKFFPPPKFLQMPAVGLDISDASMRFVELVETKQGLVLGRFGEQNIPRGIIESGEVKKAPELRAILAKLKSTYDLEFANVSLPEEKAYLFSLSLPAMKYNEIRGAIELVLEEHVPIKASEALFDYSIIKETETTLRVNVSVIPFALTDGYLESLEETGIVPTVFEVEAQAIVRAVVPKGKEGASMVVDLGKTRTGIAIVVNDSVQFTSTLAIGGGALTDIFEKKMGISRDDAEKMKREKGVLGVDGGNDDLSHALLSVVSILRDEIHKHYTYWQSYDDEYGKKRPAIQNVYLCGGDANLAGLTEYFAERLGTPVELANVFVNINSLEQYIPEIGFSDSLRYATAIGLALRPSA